MPTHRNRSALKTRRPRQAALLATFIATMTAVASRSPEARPAVAETGTFHLPTSYGALKNEWCFPDQALLNDGAYAKGLPYDVNGDEQSFEAFDLQIPTGATIDGIALRIEAYSDDEGSDCHLHAKLFWRTDGGWSAFHTGYKTWQYVPAETTAMTLGGPGDTWGRACWVPEEFSDGAFAVGLLAEGDSGCGYDDHVFVDYVGVQVYRDAPPIDQLTPGTDNPALTRAACNKADLAFVIDNSDSIGAYSSTVTSGITSFMDAFESAGRDGRYSVTAFNGESGTTLTAGYVISSELQDALDTLPPPSDLTPAGAGIAAALDNVTNDRADAPDVLVAITDGSPNVPPPAAQYDPDDPAVWLTAANAAIAEANAARADGFVVRGIIEGEPSDDLPWSEQADQDWVNAVMARIDGRVTGAAIGDYVGLASQVWSRVGCRTLHVQKVVTGSGAVTETFACMVRNVGGQGQDEP